MCLRFNAYISQSPEPTNLTKDNQNKFKRYDFDKSNSIDLNEFTKICLKDEDYKLYFYNMGFITKNQMDFQDQIYDMVDSDVGE